MIHIRFNDGRVYGASDWDDLLKVVKLDTPFVPETPKNYMRNFSWRIADFMGHKISYTNAETFFMELQRVGVIENIIEGKTKEYK